MLRDFHIHFVRSPCSVTPLGHFHGNIAAPSDRSPMLPRIQNGADVTILSARQPLGLRQAPVCTTTPSLQNTRTAKERDMGTRSLCSLHAVPLELMLSVLYSLSDPLIRTCQFMLQELMLQHPPEVVIITM